MKVSTQITRGDLIRFNLALIPRIKSNRVTFAIFTVLVFATFVWFGWLVGQPFDTNDLKWMIPGSLFAAFGAMFAGMIISFSLMLANASEANGILGLHNYEIDENGLHETTGVNDATFRWQGIQETTIIAGCAAFRVSGYAFHFIPKRSFRNRRELKEFVRLSSDYWQQAHGR